MSNNNAIHGADLDPNPNHIVQASEARRMNPPPLPPPCPSLSARADPYWTGSFGSLCPMYSVHWQTSRRRSVCYRALCRL